MSKIEIAHEMSTIAPDAEAHLDAVITPNAEAHLDAVRPILRRGAWGDGVKAVCLMSTFVPGAKSFGDCVTAGWPEWLANLTATLYDADAGADDEKAEADRWAYRMAAVISRPINLVQAQHRFLIATLAPLVSLSPVVEPVINLHQRVLNDDAPLRREWEAAETAARVAWDVESTFISDVWKVAKAASAVAKATDNEYDGPSADSEYYTAHATLDATNAVSIATIDVVDTAVSATKRAEAVWAAWEAADLSVRVAWKNVDTVKAALEDDATAMLPWSITYTVTTIMAAARDNLLFILTGDRDE